MDAQGDAQDVPIDEDSALDKDGDEYAAAESEDEIVDMPSISNESRLISRALSARSLHPTREALAAAEESDQFKTARQGTTCT